MRVHLVKMTLASACVVLLCVLVWWSRLAGYPASVPQKTVQTNLSVPFMSQAPQADWGMPYQEACEEASALMAAAYAHGAPTAWTPDEADLALQKLVMWENEHFGYYQDTTVAETEQMLREALFVTSTRLMRDPDVVAIKKELSAGNVVLVPAYGKALPNPNFRNGGPLYHMLLVKGYTDTGFITNDPGTRKGRNFFYTSDTLLNANHDWNGGDVPNGGKVVLVVEKE